MKSRRCRAVLTTTLMLVAGCVMHVDKSTVVKRGDLSKSIYSMDGDVQVQALAHVRKIHVVDGHVRLGRWSHASGVRTVDGRIDMAAGASCKGDVQSVDGDISLADGVRVDGQLHTLTGAIHASSVFIGGTLETVSGALYLTGSTHVVGGILLHKPYPSVQIDDNEQRRLPLVIIGPGVVVDGRIVAQRGGTLKVSRQAHIGPVEGIKVQWFDGAASSAITTSTARP